MRSAVVRPIRRKRLPVACIFVATVVAASITTSCFLGQPKCKPGCAAGDEAWGGATNDGGDGGARHSGGTEGLGGADVGDDEMNGGAGGGGRAAP